MSSVMKIQKSVGNKIKNVIGRNNSKEQFLLDDRKDTIDQSEWENLKQSEPQDSKDIIQRKDTFCK